MRYAQALSDWAEARGYEAETLWDMCTTAALGIPYEKAQFRELRTLSGGEQKRLVLEALLRGPDEVLLLDEPDNYLDVPGKRWLEERLKETRKTVLFVSHDRELLARTAEKIVSVEPSPAGSDVWVHGGGFGTYHEARKERFARFEELKRRWDEEHARLKALVLRLRQQAAISPDMASRYQAMQTRFKKFEEAGPPPEPPREQEIRMRLRGGRTGVRALTCQPAGADGADETLRSGGLLRRAGRGPRVERLGQVALPAAPRGRCVRGPHRRVEARRARGARPLRPDARAPRAAGAHAGRHPVDRARQGPRRRDVGAAAVRAGAPGRPALRQALRRPAGPLPDPAPGAARAPRRCFWTSRRTTWTWSRRRRCRTAWRRTRAPCSR